VATELRLDASATSSLRFDDFHRRSLSDVNNSVQTVQPSGLA
jgi:hypothetical protein